MTRSPSTTLQGRFHYEVIGTEIVRPDQVEVVDDKGDDRLTLTSCHPKYSARQRIIVSAALVNEPAPSTTTTTSTTVVRDELPSEDVPPPTDLESLDAGHTRTAGPAVLWGSDHRRGLAGVLRPVPPLAPLACLPAGRAGVPGVPLRVLRVVLRAAPRQLLTVRSPGCELAGW